MTKTLKAHLRHIPTLAKDTVHPPQALPDAVAVLAMDLDLTPDEIAVIKMAMAIHAASKKPRLTWSGWKHIATALLIGQEHVKRKTKAKSLSDYKYRVMMGEFLKKSGFNFINKADRSLIVRMLENWDEIDAWRSSLSSTQRGGLHNPKDISEAYQEHLEKRGDPEAKGMRTGGKKRLLPSLLEQVAVLEEACAAAEERRDRAEAEADYFAEIAKEIAIRAKLTPEELTAIRAEARAKREPLYVVDRPDDGEE